MYSTHKYLAQFSYSVRRTKSESPITRRSSVPDPGSTATAVSAEIMLGLDIEEDMSLLSMEVLRTP